MQFAARSETFQFARLLQTAELLAYLTNRYRETELEAPFAISSLLATYAALECLAMESARDAAVETYSNRGFRMAGLHSKFQQLVGTDREVPACVSEIVMHRAALTHSEPDNERTADVGRVLNARDVGRFVAGIREVAHWLWKGARPIPVSNGFDGPNDYIDEAERLR